MNNQNFPVNEQTKFHLSNYIEILKESETAYDVFQVLKNLCKEFGYSSFIVFNMGPEPNSRLENQTLVTNWDPELIRAYDAIGLFETSPLLSALKRTNLSVFWRLEDLKPGGSNADEDVVVSLFEKHGLVSGVYVNVFNRNGMRGALGLLGDASDPDQHGLMYLSYIAGFAFEKLTDLETAGGRQKYNLTDRERECVHWTAVGKSSSEVGIILGISENTVNHHLTSAAHKLGTVNKAHTVAISIRKGLLD